VLILGGCLTVFGVVLYRASPHARDALVKDLLMRPGGPMTFRFILQPIMAAIVAFRDGLQGARLRRTPYFWTVLTDRNERLARLYGGLVSTAQIILLGIVMDAIYQYIVLKQFYPGQMVIVALLLAFVPYLLLRGLAARIFPQPAQPCSSIGKINI
jgi:hypothetical protein